MQTEEQPESVWVPGPVVPRQVDIHLALYLDVAGALDELAVAERCSISRVVGRLVEKEYRTRWPNRVPVAADARKRMWDKRRLRSTASRS